MIRVGLLLQESPFPFVMSGSIADAVREALILEQAEAEPLPVKTLGNRIELDEWKMDLGEFSLTGWVIPPNIMGTTAQGWLREHHVTAVMELNRRLMQSGSFDLHSFWRVHDFSKVQGSDWSARLLLARENTALGQKLGKPRLSVICGAGRMVKTSVQIFAGFSRSQIRYAPTLAAGLDLVVREMAVIRDASMQEPALETVDPEIQELMEYVGQLSWKDLDSSPPQVPEGHRLKGLYDTLDLVRLDIRSLLETHAQQEERLSQAQVALQASVRARRELLRVANHEIRNPMNGLNGMLELIAQCQLPDDARDYLQTALQCSGELSSLIGNLLDLSTLDSGKLQLQPVGFIPRGLVRELERKHRRNVEFHGVSFTLHEAGDLDSLTRGDRGRIFQVLDILLANAVKFTAVGTITLDASSTPTPDGNVQLEFLVSDTGVGIRTEDLPHVFEVFEQDNTQFGRQYGGVGLGLTIVGQLVRMMAGTIEAESEYGRGSRFRFSVLLPKVTA